MKAGRELILLTALLLVLVVNLYGSDNSLPFLSQNNYVSQNEGYIEVVREGKSRLLPLAEAARTFIIQNGLPLKKGDALYISKGPIQRSTMRGGTLLLLGLPINVNLATIEDLTAISGVGPKTAEAIVAFREKNGPYRSLLDLIKVKGIGKKRLSEMKKFLTI